MVHVQKNTQHSIKLGDGIWVVASFPGVTSGKESAANAGDARDVGSIPGSGRSPGVRNGNSLQYSCLENSIDRGI